MSAAVIDRALAWKEARDLRMSGLVLGAALLGLTVLAIVATRAGALTTPFARDLLLLILVPAIASAIGASAIAEERGASTLPWLLARPVAPRRTLLVKVAVRGVALVAWLAVSAVAILAVVTLGAASEDAAWSPVLGVGAGRAWALGLVLAVASFAWGVALSIALPDELTAAVGAAVSSALATMALAAPWLAIGGDVATALASWPAWVPTAVVAPAAFALLLARRFGPGEPAQWTAPWSLATTAALVVLIGLTWMGSAEARGAAQARAGLGEARGPLLSAPRDEAVAFVVAPPSGSPRAVVGWRHLSWRDASVLPPGTVPIAWTEDGSRLVVRWNGGAERLVDPLSSRSEPAGDDVLRHRPHAGGWILDGGRVSIEDARGRAVVHGGAR